MDSFLIDLHVHTAQTSSCGQVQAKDVVCQYLKSGYQGIVITDHFHKPYFDSLGSLPWEDKITTYMEGYLAAVQAAKETSLRIYFGIEFRNLETDDDFLIYGLDKDFLIQNPDLFEVPLTQAFDRFHQAGAFVLQAHPVRLRLALPMGNSLFKGFRQPAMLNQLKAYPHTPQVPWKDQDQLLNSPQTPSFLRICDLRLPEKLDGIEAFNGNTHWCQDPKEVDGILKKHPHLVAISSSDFHEPAHLAKGGTYFSLLPQNNGELATALKNRKIFGYRTSNGVKLNQQGHLIPGP